MARLATLNKSMTGPTIDPVCGLRMDAMTANLVASYQGRNYYFCAEACSRAFEKKPEKYLKRTPVKIKGPQGWWGRYLERMAKANEELFGGRPRHCH